MNIKCSKTSVILFVLAISLCFLICFSSSEDLSSCNSLECQQEVTFVKMSGQSLTKPTAVRTEYTYNILDITLEMDENFDAATMNISGNVGTNAGDYQAIISLKNPEDTWSDGTTDDILIDWKINKCAPVIPTLNRYVFEYSGNEVDIKRYMSSAFRDDIMVLVGDTNETEVGPYEFKLEIRFECRQNYELRQNGEVVSEVNFDWEIKEKPDVLPYMLITFGGITLTAIALGFGIYLIDPRRIKKK